MGKMKLKKYSGGTKGVEKKSLTGKIVKKAKPVAPAYLPSSKVKKGYGNILSVSEGGDSSKRGRDLSNSVSGAGMVKTKKMSLTKK